MFDTGKYGKLFLFTLGTSLLLVGFLGVMVDLSDFKITEFGNFLIMTMALDLLKKEIPDIKAEEVLMVGDSMARDIVPAKRFGLQTALSKYGQIGAELGSADFDFDSFEDILTVL
jgi:phosphoglycolate phosphatase-like HAD superfamily hydrolase